MRDGILFAQAFDERALRTSGEPFRVADGVGYWAAAFAYTAVTASSSGVLAHGPNMVFTTSLRWHDRAGSDNRTAHRSAGVRIAAPVARSNQRHGRDHRCHDGAARSLAAGARPRHNLTRDVRSIERLVSCVVARRQPHFLRVGADGLDDDFPEVWCFTRRAVRGQLSWSVATYPNDVSQDGRFLMYQQSTSGGYNLGVIPLSGDRKPTPFVAGPSNEVQGRFSPNHRWIAYASDESGQFEVYVRPFPAETYAIDDDLDRRRHAARMAARRQRALLHFGRRQADGGAGRDR